MNQRIHKELHLHHCKSPDPDPCQPHLWNSSTTKSTRIKSLACNGCETKKNMRASWGFEQVISDLAFESWPEFEGYIVHLQNILQFTHHFVCLFIFFILSLDSSCRFHYTFIVSSCSFGRVSLSALKPCLMSSSGSPWHRRK